MIKKQIHKISKAAVRRCSSKFDNVRRKTHLLELLFNKVAGLENWNCIKKRLQRKCFLANIAKFFRTPILKYITERQLLY